MKKSAVLAGFLAAIPMAAIIMQHTVLAMELDSFSLGDIKVKSKYQGQKEEDAQVLAASTNKPSEAQPEEKPAPVEPKETYVVVAKGDSLSKIAAAHGTTFKRLFDANEFIADPNVINPGDKIRIPKADEQLPDRKLPAPKPKEVVASKSTAKPSSRKAYSTNAPAVASGSVWDRLAACESGGNWSINTGNGYYGGLQFLPSTWRAVGGTGLPHQHSREEQIKRAEILLARSGWGQWPACSAKLGLR